MTTIDSRPGVGTLTLGTTDHGAQIPNVALEPVHSKEDGIPTLGDPNPPPTVTTKWVLKGDLIQDWQSSDGIVEYLRANNGEEVAFELLLNEDLGIVYSGSCTVYAVTIGGNVKQRNTSPFEFDVVDEPTRTVNGVTPSAPLNLTAEAIDDDVISLDWDAPLIGDPTSYKVYQSSTLGGVYSEVTTNITKVGTTARVANLNAATAYFFKVAGVNGDGTGTQSGAVTATTDA